MRADILQPYLVRLISSCCSNIFHFLPFFSVVLMLVSTKMSAAKLRAGPELEVSDASLCNGRDFWIRETSRKFECIHRAGQRSEKALSHIACSISHAVCNDVKNLHKRTVCNPDASRCVYVCVLDYYSFFVGVRMDLNLDVSKYPSRPARREQER